VPVFVECPDLTPPTDVYGVELFPVASNKKE
jgi:hypothetical protein